MTVYNFKVKEIIKPILFVLFCPFIIFIENLSAADEDLNAVILDWFYFLLSIMSYYGIPTLLIWGLVCHTTTTLIVLGFTVGLALFIAGIPWMLWKIVKMLIRYFGEKRNF